MPDDSSPEFKAAQQKHAAQIKAERSVMDALGISRSQARAVMQSRLRQSTQGFLDRRSPLFSPPPLVARPDVTITKQSLPLVATSTGDKQHPQTIPSSPTQGLAIPDPPSSGTYVLTSVDGVLDWTATTECPMA